MLVLNFFSTRINNSYFQVPYSLYNNVGETVKSTPVEAVQEQLPTNPHLYERLFALYSFFLSGSSKYPILFHSFFESECLSV